MLTSGTISLAQDSTDIHAKIIDGKTKVPIAFATVRIMKGGEFRWGVISNTDGDFQIPSRYRPVIDSLVITCIGYQNKVIKIDQFVGAKLHIINLKSGAVELPEVMVSAPRKRRLTANQIVRLAIRNIPNNYPKYPFSYVGYYRDYQKEENEYVNLNEGIVGIFDEGFSTNDFSSTKIKLYQYRLNRDFKRDSLTAIPYDNNSFSGNKFIPTATVSPFGGNELSQLMVHDAIRNNKVDSYSFVNEFDTDFLKNHSFNLVRSVDVDNVPIYHITFKAFYFVTGARHVAKGDIFIEHGNYAIHKLNYSTFLKDQNKENLLYNIQVEYARRDSLMYLNYISFNNVFESNTNEGFRVIDVVYDRAQSCFVITFNHLPQPASALDKKNYDFKFNKSPLKISKITFSDAEKKDKIIQVFIQNADEFNLWESPNVLASKFEASFKNIKDMWGNEVNEIKYKLVNQFRELFPQKLNPTVILNNTSLFLVKKKPLNQSKVDSLGPDPSAYWMNTPLKKN